jgi:hypothetical protein
MAERRLELAHGRIAGLMAVEANRGVARQGRDPSGPLAAGAWRHLRAVAPFLCRHCGRQLPARPLMKITM